MQEKNKKKEISPELEKCRELLKELVVGIYGYRQINCYPKNEDNPAEFEIKLRNVDYVSVFQQTNIYKKNFRNIFIYTFMPPKGADVKFEIGRPDSVVKEFERQQYISRIIENTIKSFVSKDALKDIFENLTPQGNSFHVTAKSVFEVMENYDSLLGIPVICTKEQEAKCLERYSSQNVSEVQEDDSFYHGWTFERFCREYSISADKFSKPICNWLVNEMLDLFLKKEITSEELESQYKYQCEIMGEKLQDMLREEVNRKLEAGRICSSDEIKQIILIDSDTNPL